MKEAQCSDAAIAAFKYNFEVLASGKDLNIPEASISPVESLPTYDELKEPEGTAELLKQTVVLKLNGGLGTGMGLDKAKSLLPITTTESGEKITFLDFIAKQARAGLPSARWPARRALACPTPAGLPDARWPAKRHPPSAV